MFAEFRCLWDHREGSHILSHILPSSIFSDCHSATLSPTLPQVQGVGDTRGARSPYHGLAKKRATSACLAWLDNLEAHLRPPPVKKCPALRILPAIHTLLIGGQVGLVAFLLLLCFQDILSSRARTLVNPYQPSVAPWRPVSASIGPIGLGPICSFRPRFSTTWPGLSIGAGGYLPLRSPTLFLSFSVYFSAFHFLSKHT